MKDINIAYYNQNAQSFYQNSVEADMSEWQNRFLNHIPAGGRILDAGCGSGRDSKAFIKQGYSVVAFDASSELCRLASKLLAQEVWQMKFQEISFDEEFDGVWACASLLHVSSEEIDDVMGRIYKSLQKGGFFYASFKKGDGKTEKNGRLFSNYNEITARKLFDKAGFEVIECEESFDVRPGREGEEWINVIARK